MREATERCDACNGAGNFLDESCVACGGSGKVCAECGSMADDSGCLGLCDTQKDVR